MIESIGIDLKRNTNLTGFVILVLFIAFALFINQSSVSKIKELEKTKEEFIKSENKKVDLTESYRQYGGYGYKFLFVPPNVALMFKSSTSINLQASIDTSFKLDIFNPKKGEYVFKRGLDLYWYLLVIGGILSLAFGWIAFRDQRFIKVLMVNSCSKNKFLVYGSILAARTILIFLSLSILTICMLAQYYINGISLNGSEFVIIMLMIFGVMFFLLILGSVLGTIKSASRSGIITFIFWFIIMFLWPNFFNLKFSEKAEKNMKSIYDIETEKVEILYGFEKNRINYVKDKEDKFKATREFTEKFLNDGIAERLELELIEDTESNVKKLHLWSIINPATFYESAINETCGNGFSEHHRFCRESIVKKREFSKYCVNKIFSKQTGKVEPFLKGDEYFFYAKPSLPAYFWLGVLLQILYILALFIIGFFRFKRIMFPIEKEKVCSNLDLKLKKGRHYVYSYNANEPDFPEQVYNVLMGNARKFTGKISVDGENIVTREKKNLVYLPVPDALPGQVKVKAIINLFAGLFKIPKSEKDNIKGEFKKILNERFGEIEEIEKVNLMIRMAEYKKADIYLLHNLLININPELLPGIVVKIKKENTLIIEMDSIHVRYGEFDRYDKIQLDKDSKYENPKITGE